MGRKIGMKDSSVGGVDPGKYGAEITDYTFDQSVHGEIIKFKMRLVEPKLDNKPVDGDPVELTYLTSTIFSNHKKCKLRKLAEACGIKKQPGEALDLDELEGKKLQVMVVDKPMDDDPETVFSQITELYRAKAK